MQQRGLYSLNLFLSTLKYFSEDEFVLGQPWGGADMKGDDYSGYAVTSGMFREGGPQYVFGSPRGGQFRTGQVFLVKPFLGEKQKEMQLIQRLSGKD